ncbi:hypothetical protein [Algoriphagus resistens]|uniref:hypothetical protein n=1 Tax=Algoriphagus resistens TaxID=1750590 RepID=UPI000716923B|nr:hypothetical protein [Algoriphagus resistens]
MKFSDLIKRELISGRDFGVELNLGFQSHYDFLKSIKSFNPNNSVEVVLFHTDDISLCLDRAKTRHEQGLHLVPPETIQEMYDNTIPLLKENLHLTTSLLAIDVTANDIEPELRIKYKDDSTKLEVFGRQSIWIEKELIPILQLAIKQRLELSPNETKKVPKHRRGPKL